MHAYAFAHAMVQVGLPSKGWHHFSSAAALHLSAAPPYVKPPKAPERVAFDTLQHNDIDAVESTEHADISNAGR